jgi:acyl-coenzyme A thioesterase PaaI-like protein
MATTDDAACKKSDLVCAAHTIRRGKELTFVDMLATDALGAVVAQGMLTYRIA